MLLVSVNRFISIPRDALAALLKASGSALTPEEYLASLTELTAFAKYPGRARAAALSRNILVFVAVLAVLALPFGFDLEDVIIVAGLATVTFYEYRVHRYFRDLNPAAPMLGFRNQAAFAAAILTYGLYHTFVPPQVEIPSEYREVMDPSMTTMIAPLEQIFYLVIGIVGGISQFGLAWYYRRARLPAQP